MLKRLTALVALGILCAAFLFSQRSQKSYTYTFTNGIGDCTFTGVSFDAVWAALVKAFMTQDAKGKDVWHGLPVVPNRPSNSMTGVWAGNNTLVKPGCSLQILVEQRSQGIGVYCAVADNAEGNEEKIEEAFYDKVAELLYGKVEK